MQSWTRDREIEKTLTQKAEDTRARLQRAVQAARVVLGYNAEVVHAMEHAIEILGQLIERDVIHAE